MGKIFLIVVILSTYSVKFYGQSTPEKLVNAFFGTYKVNPSKAVRDIYKTNIWTASAKSDIDKVVNTVNGFSKANMGSYNGFELISTKTVSKSYQLRSYLVKYDRQPLRYLFRFYKAKDKWVLYSFSLDGEVEKDI